MILPSLHEYPWETVVARDLLAEVERLQVELGGQLGAYLMVVDENTTLRVALERLDRQSVNLYCCYHRKMGKAHTHDCYIGKALATTQEDKANDV